MDRHLLIIFGLLITVLVIFQALTYRLEQRSPTIAKEAQQDINVSAFVGDHYFTLYGYSSPMAQVTFDGLGIYDQTTADNKGYFEFKNRFSPLSPREACLTAKDQLGRLTAPVCLPPFPTSYDANIGPVIMPPTVSLNSSPTGGNYYVGDEIVLSGQTVPNTAVDFSVYMNNTRSTQITPIVKSPKIPVLSRACRQAGTSRSQPRCSYCAKYTVSRIFNQLFSLLASPVEAYSFPSLSTTSDTKGNFSLSLPSANPQTFRLFARSLLHPSGVSGQTDWLSPDSIELNLQIMPWWMIIVQIFLLLLLMIRSRLLEVIIFIELVLITAYLLRRFLHPYVIARNRALTLREVSLVVAEKNALALTG